MEDTACKRGIEMATTIPARLFFLLTEEAATVELRKMARYNGQGVMCCGSVNWPEGRQDIPPLGMSLKNLPPDELA